MRKSLVKRSAACLAMLAVMLPPVGVAFAREGHDGDRGRIEAPRGGDHGWMGGTGAFPLRRGEAVPVPPDRFRRYRDITIIRPYGHWYPGFGWYRDDDAAYPFLAFTAITMLLLADLSEDQERAHEDAQVRATTAAVGETITWNQGDASGSVTTLRDGQSSSGRYCREFQQTINVGGKSEQAYGTACRQPDGTWEIVSTGNQP